MKNNFIFFNANSIDRKFQTIAFFLLLFSANSFAQQVDAGAFYTPEEVAVWRTRAQNGPYKTFGDVSQNSPGDWDRINTNANDFISNPAYQRLSLATLSNTGLTFPVQKSSAYDPRWDAAIGLRDCAFRYLLFKNSNDLVKIKAEFLSQMREEILDFGDHTVWQHEIKIMDTNPTFIFAEALMRLLFTYDYLGRSAFSTTELAEIDAKFLKAAEFMEEVDKSLQERFFASVADRDKGILKPEKEIIKYDLKNNFIPYLPNPAKDSISGFAKAYNNRMAKMFRFMAATGVYLDKYSNNSSHKQSASYLKYISKRFVQEMIKYSFFPNGFMGDFERWQPIEDNSKSGPDQGYAYSNSALAALIDIASYLARAGDPSLFTYSTLEGAAKSKSTTVQKSLLFMVTKFGEYANGTIKRYGTDNPSFINNTTYQIDGESNNWANVEYVSYSIGNKFWKDSLVEGYYTRTGNNMTPYPNIPGEDYVRNWQGTGYIYPGVLFMFGQTEYLNCPYGNTAPTANAGADKSITLPTNSITLSGTVADADGRIQTYTWTKQYGPAATLTNAGTATLTASSLVAGTYVFRLSITDNCGKTAFDEVTLTVNNTGTALYRAINLNGSALTIGNQSWEASTAANFSFTGRTFANQSVTLSPTTDANRATMIRSSIWKTLGADSVTATLTSVPAGEYEVFVYTWEDNTSTTFSLYLEGALKVANFASGNAGSWKKHNLGRVTITDGDIKIKAVGGDATISGIEIWKVQPIFYRAVNLNGTALTIDGNAWEASTAANFSFTGRTFANQSVTLSPTTDANRATMIRSNIYRTSGTDSVTAKLSAIPTGEYEVYVYTWENDASATFNLYLEGVLKVANYVSGNAGSWKKHNLGRVTITDGDIKIKAVGGDANLSGFEVWKINASSASRLAYTHPIEEQTSTASPNPFKNELQVNLLPQERSASSLRWAMTDLSGRVYKSAKVSVVPAQTSLKITHLEGLTSGFYLLRLQCAQFNRVIKVIKQ